MPENTEKAPTVEEIMEAVKHYGDRRAFEEGSGRGEDTDGELYDVRVLVERLAAGRASSGGPANG